MSLVAKVTNHQQPLGARGIVVVVIQGSKDGTRRRRRRARRGGGGGRGGVGGLVGKEAPGLEVVVHLVVKGRRDGAGRQPRRSAIFFLGEVMRWAQGMRGVGLDVSECAIDEINPRQPSATHPSIKRVEYPTLTPSMVITYRDEPDRIMS